MLKAVKCWDKFVFKKDLGLSSGSAAATAAGGSENEEAFLDNDNRPKQKVIMLCGPPGTGKVSL